MDRAKWDRRMMELTKLVSTWSKDPRTSCGAVVVEGKRVMGLGFNGFPPGIEDTPERLNNRDVKLRLTIHAEINAINYAGHTAEERTLYVYPLCPCAACGAYITQPWTGITRVVYPPMPDKNKEHWADDCMLSMQVMVETGIELSEFQVDKPTKSTAEMHRITIPTSNDGGHR